MHIDDKVAHRIRGGLAMPEIRVLVSHDNSMMRQVAANYLRVINEVGDSEAVVVGEAEDGWETVTKAVQLEPDLVILHASMSYENSSSGSVAHEIKKQLPLCKILMVSADAFLFPQTARAAIEQGASGVIGGPRMWDDVIAYTELVMEGGYALNPKVRPEHLAPRKIPLSRRERDVLVAASDGSSTEEIARRMHLAKSTIRRYISSAIRKTGAHSRSAASKLVLEQSRLERAHKWLTEHPPGESTKGT
jgi:two-component system response regulator DesR